MGDCRRPLRHLFIPCLPVAPASSKPVPEPDHVTPAAPASSRALTSRASRGQELSGYLWPRGSISSGRGQLVCRGPLINSRGRREHPSPQKLISRRPLRNRDQSMCGRLVAHGGVWAAERSGRRAGRAPTVPLSKDLPVSQSGPLGPACTGLERRCVRKEESLGIGENGPHRCVSHQLVV